MEKVVICILGLSVLCLVESFTAPSVFWVSPSAGGGGSKTAPCAGSQAPPTAAGSKPPSALGATGAGAASPAPTGPGNFNLSTPQGVQNFLNTQGINATSLVTTNCTSNGNPCTIGGQSCCLSPVFSCQGIPSMCKVVPAHISHIPQIQQIVQTAGYTTVNPIL